MLGCASHSSGIGGQDEAAAVGTAWPPASLVSGRATSTCWVLGCASHSSGIGGQDDAAAVGTAWPPASLVSGGANARAGFFLGTRARYGDGHNETTAATSPMPASSSTCSFSSKTPPADCAFGAPVPIRAVAALRTVSACVTAFIPSMQSCSTSPVRESSVLPAVSACVTAFIPSMQSCSTSPVRESSVLPAVSACVTAFIPSKAAVSASVTPFISPAQSFRFPPVSVLV